MQCPGWEQRNQVNTLPIVVRLLKYRCYVGKTVKHPEIYPDLGVISMRDCFFQACNLIFSRKQHFKPVLPHPLNLGPKQQALSAEKPSQCYTNATTFRDTQCLRVLKLVVPTILVQIPQGSWSYQRELWVIVKRSRQFLTCNLSFLTLKTIFLVFLYLTQPPEVGSMWN